MTLLVPRYILNKVLRRSHPSDTIFKAIVPQLLPSKLAEVNNEITRKALINVISYVRRYRRKVCISETEDFAGARPENSTKGRSKTKCVTCRGNLIMLNL